MEIGGAERALLGLLDAIDTDQYQVDLFLLRHQGPFMHFIPNEINILKENSKYSDLGVPIEQVLKKGHFDMAYGRLRGKYAAKHFVKKYNLRAANSVEIHYSFKYTLKYLPNISDTQYDLALGFTIPYYILDKKVMAKKKAVWIHTDYTERDGDRKEELKVWEVYPYIVSISEAVTESFLTVYPSLKSKIYPIDNIVSETFIRKQAELLDVKTEMPSDNTITYLLSIGRFSKQKNFENIPDICAKILQNGINVKWYIIGFGGDRELIEHNIKVAGVEENVILLGKKDNPYPYIKKCDIYVQPSRYEGKAVAVREAQILHKPVIITNFPTAFSQLNDGVDGIIVPMDNAGCAKGISDLIQDKNRQQQLIANCSSTCYSNRDEVNKLYALIE